MCTESFTAWRLSVYVGRLPSGEALPPNSHEPNVDS